MGRNKRRARAQREKPRRTKEEWEAMKKANPGLEEKSAAYRLAEKTNARFEKFYEGIGVVPEGEWQDFLDIMKKPLPTTFRITGSRNQAQELLKIIKGQYLSKLTDEYVADVKVDPHSLPWYPDEMAWQLDFTRKEIRDNNTLKSLHGFLVSETESGNISRQEAVSMLPPLLMDIQPHHKVLDMCAAPGSKTAQLIEMLHSNDEFPEPEGFVVANDMDNRRCYLMTHQVKRIQSPNCMIINHDARILPNMVLSKDQGSPFVKYDRVLCDVPCSGDGTMRKNPDIWGKWHVNGAYNLHRIQKKVLQRGLELLTIGGKLVYSTCSLNPVENEAVLLAIIKQCQGAIELLDVSDKLQGLKYSKGTYSWKIMTTEGNWYERLDQAPEKFQKNWDSTIYPPLITEAQDAKLERCIRVLPHAQNTGAFFIAVLQKTKDLPWMSGRTQKLAPVINPKLSVDPSEQIDSLHFSFGIRSNSGLYLYGKCNLCNVLIQSRSEMDSHKNGRKHTMNLEIYEEKKSKSEKPVPVDNGKIDEAVKDTSDTTTTATTEKIEVDSNTQQEPPAKRCKTEDGAESTEKSPQIDQKSVTGDSETTAQESTPQTSNTEKTKEDSNPDGEPIKVVLRGYKEDPFYFCSKNEPVWAKIKAFYEVTDEFNVEQLMFRNMKRVLYYVSRSIRDLVLCNDERVKFINLGVKCFNNAPSPLVTDCDYRLSQEGMLAVQTKIKGRRVKLTKDDVVILLGQESPFIFKFSNKTQEELHLLSPGSAIFEFTPSESDPLPNVNIVFCGWRGKTSVRSFVSKDERSHYLRLCGVELSDIQAKIEEEKQSGDIAPMGESGTSTPVGVPSGDEEEVKKWTVGDEDPRGTEEDETEPVEDKEGQNGEASKGDKGESSVDVQKGEKTDDSKAMDTDQAAVK